MTNWRFIITSGFLFCLLFWGPDSIGRSLARPGHPAADEPSVSLPADDPREDPAQPPENDETYQLLRTFASVLDEIERNYVDEVDRGALMEAAINGMLEELDQHSAYIGINEIDQFRDALENEYGGIGVQDSIEEGELVVISPIYDSPAYRLGIMAGDRILSIEGHSTEGMTLDRAVELTKGEVGTTVRVSVLHPHNGEVEQLEIPRALIKLTTVLGDIRRDDDTWQFMLPATDGIGYIRLTGFGRTTASDLADALTELSDAGLRGLILDLRFNPGGLLSSAIQVSDLFVEEGIIVSTEGRNSQPREWSAMAPGTYLDFPMVVMVNRFSASASEIVAACLKDHGRAVIVGERTFGKGSVQNVIPLDGGLSALKLTTAGYRRPNGQNIHRREGAEEGEIWGVHPSEGFELVLSDEAIGQYLIRRRDRDIIGPSEPGAGTTQEQQDFVDGQLELALSCLNRILGDSAADQADRTEEAASTGGDDE